MRNQEALQLRACAISAGLISKDWSFLATPMVLDAAELRQLETDLAALEDLLFSFPERFFGGSLGTMATALGLDRGLCALLDSARPLEARFPLRWDLIREAGGRYRVLEVNTGYCLGGLNTAGLAHAYEQPGLEFFDTDAELRVHLCARIAGGHHLHIVEMDHLFGDYGFFANALARNLSHGDALMVTCGPLSNLPNIDGVDGVIPMMTFQELLSSQNLGALWLLEHLDLSILHPSESLFNDKELLAWLHDRQFTSDFTTAERALVERLVPSTIRLDGRNTHEPLAGDWILKPAASYGGEGVKCQWESSDWAADLRAAQASGDRHILQCAVRSQSAVFVTIHGNEHVRRGRGEPVLGLITIDGSICGGFSRVTLGQMRAGVTNAHCGAASGWVAVDRSEMR